MQGQFSTSCMDCLTSPAPATTVYDNFDVNRHVSSFKGFDLYVLDLLYAGLNVWLLLLRCKLAGLGESFAFFVQIGYSMINQYCLLF